MGPPHIVAASIMVTKCAASGSPASEDDRQLPSQVGLLVGMAPRQRSGTPTPARARPPSFVRGQLSSHGRRGGQRDLQTPSGTHTDTKHKHTTASMREHN